MLKNIMLDVVTKCWGLDLTKIHTLRWRDMSLASIAMAAFLVVPQMSMAEIFPIDIGTTRVVVQLHDNGSGLVPVRVWLGAQHTKAMSYQEVEDAVASGSLQGWTIAHEVDVRALFADADLIPFGHLTYQGSKEGPLTSFTDSFTAICEAFIQGNCAPSVVGMTTTRRGRTAEVSSDGINQVAFLLEQRNAGPAVVEASNRVPGDFFNFTIDNTLADDTVFAWLYRDL